MHVFSDYLVEASYDTLLLYRLCYNLVMSYLYNVMYIEVCYYLEWVVCVRQKRTISTTFCILWYVPHVTKLIHAMQSTHAHKHMHLSNCDAYYYSITFWFALKISLPDL